MGLFDGLLGGGGGSADDPYADILTPAQRNQMQVQGLLAMAGAFAQAGMPSRLPVPFGSALGSAAAALGTGQEAGMTAAIANAYKAQQVRDLRAKAALQGKLSPIFQDLLDRIRTGQGVGPGALATPQPGTAGPGSGGGGAAPAPSGAGDGGGLLSPDLSLGSDTTPDYFTRGLAPKAPGGLLDYPADQGTMRAGGGLVPERPEAGIGTATPSSAYAPGGSLYPFRDLGGVPGGASGAAPAVTGGDAAPTATWSQGPEAAEVARLDAEYAASNPKASAAAKASMHVENVIAVTGRADANAPPTPSPVPPVTSVPGGTNGIDPRKRAALDAILTGMQTAQGGPSAQRLAQFAGPGAADAPAADATPEGGGLLGVAPDLRAPIEANPLARVNAVLAQIKQRESRGNYAIPPEQNVDFPRSHASGGYQFQPGTWREWTQKSGFGQEYPQAYLAPAPVQDAVARYAALHGDVNAMSLWGASAGKTPYPNPQEGGGGPLPPDELIPSGPGAGGNRPAATLAQYAPGGAAVPGMPQLAAPSSLPGLAAPSTLPPLAAPGAAPALGAGGKIPGLNMTPQELAVIDAMAESAGLGNPFKGLLDTYYKSPGYLQESAGASARGRIAEEEPSQLRVQAQKARTDFIQKLSENALTLDKDNNVVEIPGMRDMLGQTAGEVERAKQEAQSKFKLTDVRVIGPDGQPTTVKMPEYEQIYRQQQQARNATMGARPQPGDIIGTPALSKAEEALGTGSAEDVFKARTVAQDAAQSIETTKEARKLLDSGIFAGAGSDRVTALAKIGNALNLTGTNTRETVANTEAYFATVAGNVGRMIKQFGSGTGLSDADREYAAKMVAGQQTLDEASMRKILDINDRAGFNVINRHNTNVAGIRPGASLTPLAVPVPTPYQRTYPEGFVIENGKGEQRVMRNGNWEPVTK